MKTSVIIPSYNHERFINKCLDSILLNCNPGLELLICDDCSEDSTPSLIDKWLNKSGSAFERVVFIKHKKNYGVTKTLNELIHECRGDLISPLASDDYYLREALTSRQNALYHNSQWLGAFSDGVAVDLSDEIYTKSILKTSQIKTESLDNMQIKTTVISKWAEPMNLQFWRKTAFKAHGGDFEFDENVFCEDLDFALWAVSRNSFGYLDHKTVAYRCRTWPQSSPEISHIALRGKLLDMAYVYGKSARLFQKPYREFLSKKSEYHLAAACENYSAVGALEKYLIQGVDPSLFHKIKYMLSRL